MMVEHRSCGQQAQQADLEKVPRVARKSLVDGLDIQRFFGASPRIKASIDPPLNTYKGMPAKKPQSRDINLPHEIIEAILSHLPTFDLIVATGASE